LAVYDAVYLDLAMRLGLPLATLDERLSAAATQVGLARVEVL
jgi:predicted nucleic acid-binding protein